MNIILVVVLFVIGALFINASHIPAWLFGDGKPTHKNWKIYGAVSFVVFILMFIAANF